MLKSGPCSLKYFLFLLIVLVLMLEGGFVRAEKPSVPEQIEGVTKVDSEGLIQLAQSNELVMVDARMPGDRLEGYIEDSISLPDINTSCASLGKVIPIKDHPVVFYCNGVKCARSSHSIKIALSCGFTQIYWFRGGFLEWRNKGYPYLME